MNKFITLVMVLCSMVFFVNQSIAANPEPEIMANGLDDTVMITTDESLTISVGLDSGDYSGQGGDWWLVENAPDGSWYYLDSMTFNWTSWDILLPLQPVYQGALEDFSPIDISVLSGLSTGTYQFHFAVDLETDGMLNEQFFIDTVNVIVDGSSDKFETVRAYIEEWLSEAASDKPVKTSSYVKESIVDDWENLENNYQIVSVRSEDDYANSGHVPEAINIQWKDLVDESSLSKLDAAKILIVYCYTGHTGMLSTTILSLLEYDAYNLKFGMMDWNLEAFNKTPWDMEADYDVETTVNVVDMEYSYPAINSEQNNAVDIIKENAGNYLPDATVAMSSSSVKDLVDDWENNKDQYQILSVRTTEDYETGHVPYAINIPWTEIANEDNLRKLDPEKTIIVYCYTGHTGQIVTTLLNMLGYNAINMKYGMMDWNKSLVDESKQWDGEADYPVEYSTE